MIAKAAHGIADDALTTLLLAARCPVLIAPAMDGGMFDHPAMQENLDTLRKRGAYIIVIARFIPGGRTAVTFSAGYVHSLSWRRFIRYDLVAGAIWATYAALLGYFGGRTFEENPVWGLLLAFAIATTLAVLVEAGYSPVALVTTTYGLVLIAKVTLFGATMPIAAGSNWLRPRQKAPGRFSRCRSWASVGTLALCRKGPRRCGRGIGALM